MSVAFNIFAGLSASVGPIEISASGSSSITGVNAISLVQTISSAGEHLNITDSVSGVDFVWVFLKNLGASGTYITLGLDNESDPVIYMVRLESGESSVFKFDQSLGVLHAKSGVTSADLQIVAVSIPD